VLSSSLLGPDPDPPLFLTSISISSFVPSIHTILSLLPLSSSTLHPALSQNKDGRSALNIAAFHGQTRACEAFLGADDIDLNQKDRFGYSPLMNTTYNGHTETCSLLANAPGVDLRTTEGSYGSGLLDVAKSAKIKSLLRKAGAR
jgi:ankyrin repeat protein